MNEALDIACAVFVLGGSFFCVVGGIGLVRMPDFYSRCHAAGMTDSAGAAGILVGLLFVSDFIVAIKLVTVLIFTWLSSVAATHALVKAAYAQGVRVEKPRLKDWTMAEGDGVAPHAPPSNTRQPVDTPESPS